MAHKNLDYFLEKYSYKISKLAQVGAHFGQELASFDKLNIEKIYLFEANEAALEELNKKIKNKKKFTVLPYALGNKNSRTQIFHSIENDGQSSSLLKPKLHKYVQPKINFDESFEVELRRFEDLEIEDINFLIMDVQGFELEVLKGFGKKLFSVNFIFTEVNRDYLYEDNVLINELDTYLESKKYIRIWTTWRTADMPWGDAFYIKETEISKFQKILFKLKNFITTNRVFFTIYRILDIRILKKRIRSYLNSI